MREPEPDSSYEAVHELKTQQFGRRYEIRRGGWRETERKLDGDLLSENGGRSVPLCTGKKKALGKR